MAKLWHLVEFICKHMPEPRKDSILSISTKTWIRMKTRIRNQLNTYQLFRGPTNILIPLSVHYQIKSHHQRQKVIRVALCMRVCPYCGKRHSNISHLCKHPRQRKYRARNLSVEMERGGPDGVVYVFPSSLGFGQNRTDKLQVSKLCVENSSGDRCDAF